MRIVGLISVTLISVLIGVIVGRNSISSGRYLLNTLVGTAAFGPLMYGGFTWYDETFLIGLLGIIFFKQIKIPTKDLIKNQKIYFVFLIYFLFEFLNGAYFFFNNNEDILRKFRWLVYLILLVLVATFGNIDKNKKFEVTNNHLWSIFAFLILYLTSNYLVVLKKGSAAYAQYAQVPERGYFDAIWANTAYVTLSIHIFMYIGLIGLIQKTSKLNEALSRLVLSISTLIYGLTLSRSGFFLTALLVGAFIISQKGWKNPLHTAILMSLALAPMIIGLNASGKGNLEGFVSDIKNTVLVLFDENRVSGREADRIQQYVEVYSFTSNSNQQNSLSSSSNIESESLSSWHRVFGYGLRTSGLVLSISNENPDQTKYSMSFAPSIPIEFGYIGFVIFILVLLVSARRLFRSESKDKLLVIALVTGGVLTTTVVNNFDYIPLYLLISSTINLSRTEYTKDSKWLEQS